MDSSGKIIWARHNEVQTVNVKSLGADYELTDGERLPLAVKDLGACDFYPQVRCRTGLFWGGGMYSPGGGVRAGWSGWWWVVGGGEDELTDGEPASGCHGPGRPVPTGVLRGGGNKFRDGLLHHSSLPGMQGCMGLLRQSAGGRMLLGVLVSGLVAVHTTSWAPHPTPCLLCAEPEAQQQRPLCDCVW